MRARSASAFAAFARAAAICASSAARWPVALLDLRLRLPVDAAPPAAARAAARSASACASRTAYSRSIDLHEQRVRAARGRCR